MLINQFSRSSCFSRPFDISAEGSFILCPKVFMWQFQLMRKMQTPVITSFNKTYCPGKS